MIDNCEVGIPINEAGIDGAGNDDGTAVKVTDETVPDKSVTGEAMTESETLDGMLTHEITTTDGCDETTT
jgi:hypothetical protein